MNVNFPPALGVPLSTPSGVSVMPVGSLPLAFLNVGAGSPEAVNV